MWATNLSVSIGQASKRETSNTHNKPIAYAATQGMSFLAF